MRACMHARATHAPWGHLARASAPPRLGPGRWVGPENIHVAPTALRGLRPATRGMRWPPCMPLLAPSPRTCDRFDLSPPRAAGFCLRVWVVSTRFLGDSQGIAKCYKKRDRSDTYGCMRFVFDIWCGILVRQLLFRCWQLLIPKEINPYARISLDL